MLLITIWVASVVIDNAGKFIIFKRLERWEVARGYLRRFALGLNEVNE